MTIEKTFIGKLQENWQVSDLLKTPGRINMLREGVVTLIGIKRLESEALFVSSEGSMALRETSKVNFAGRERYWWLARKFAGVLRRVLLAELRIEKCTVDKPCIDCEVCGLLGGLDPKKEGDNKAIQSRLKLQDLISVQEYEYDEKFRVRQPDDQNKENPTPFQEVIVPPGTCFPFIVRIIKPSKFDIGAFLYANQIADGLGYGNYSKLRGNATTNWVAIFNGFAHVSVYDVLSKGGELEKEMDAFAQTPKKPVTDILKGEELTNVINWANLKENWEK
jgi:hypothetical protein